MRRPHLLLLLGPLAAIALLLGVMLWAGVDLLGRPAEPAAGSGGGQLRLQLVGDSGEPVVAAVVTLRREAASRPAPDGAPGRAEPADAVEFSDERGLVEIEDLRRGNYALAIEHPQYTSAGRGLTILADRRTDLGRVRMRRGGRIEGRLTASPEADPSLSFLVECRPEGSEGRVLLEAARSDRFAFAGLARGVHEVRLLGYSDGEARGKGPWTKVTVESGETTEVEVPWGF